MTKVEENSIIFREPAVLKEEEFRTQTRYIRVYTTLPEEVTTGDVMNLIEASGTLDFWNDPEEDIYSEQDGDDV